MTMLQFLLLVGNAMVTNVVEWFATMVRCSSCCTCGESGTERRPCNYDLMNIMELYGNVSLCLCSGFKGLTMPGIVGMKGYRKQLGLKRGDTLINAIGRITYPTICLIAMRGSQHSRTIFQVFVLVVCVDCRGIHFQFLFVPQEK